MDAHRGNGKRFVVHADDKLTAFAELEAEISHAQASAEPVTAYQAGRYKNLIKLRYNSANCLSRLFSAPIPLEHKALMFAPPNSNDWQMSRHAAAWRLFVSSSSARALSFAPSTPIPRVSMQPRQRLCATRIADPHSGQTTDESFRWKQTGTLFIGNATI